MEEVVIDSIFTFVKRDFKEALDYYYPDEDYPDFAEHRLGKAGGNEFPNFVLNPRSNPTEQSGDDARVTQPVRIDSHIGVIADNHENVTRLIMRYTKVYDSVLRAAAEYHVAKREYFMNTDPATVTTPSIQISHFYGAFGSSDTGTEFFRPSLVELTITFNQSQR